MPQPQSLARLALIAPAAIGLALLGGCAVGPNWQRPAPPAAAEGYGAAPSAGVVMADGPAGRWWEGFGSPAMTALVDRAMANNASLAASNATLERAHAHIAEVAGRRLPQVDANARAEHEQANLSTYGFPLPSGFTNPIFELYTLGGGVTYDLDLWGKNRRALEAARADAEAQLHQTEAAHLTIAGRVVTQVLTIAAIRDRIAAQTALIAESQRNVDLTEARRQAGEGTMVEVLSVRSQLAADQASLPALDQQLAEARDMLAILIGVSPAELGATDFSLAGFTLPGSVPVAIPSALVHKRPDILTAEARLHASVAQIGVATASLYPDITLGGSYTQSANALRNLFSPNDRGFDIFGGITAPIFHGGTLRAQKRGAEAERKAAAASYRQTVLEAFGQVADLLNALDTDARGLATARQSASLAEQSLGLSRESFKVGNSGILQVLDASRTWQRARVALVDAQARQYLNVARLYVATAGGWTSQQAANGASGPSPAHD